jgi:type IV secretory pathway VirB10-like protein
MKSRVPRQLTSPVGEREMPWRVALSESEETKMAFSNSSYFAGVGTAFAAIAIGFAGGAMITNSAVQAPNRLERVTSGAPLPASAAVAEPTNVTTPRSPEQTASTADPQPVPQPQPASPTVAQSDAATPNAPQPTPVASSPPKGEDTATVNTRQAPSTTPPVTAKSEDASGARNERASARSGESRREIYRKRTDDRKFTERRRRQDIDEAANAVRQMQREDIIDQVVERDEVPRSNNGPLRHFFVNDDEPRYRDEPPPRFGFFGND